MSSTTTATGQIRDMARGVRRASKRDLVFRAGYAAHGVVYLLVGVMAVDAAFGGGGRAEGERGAISRIGQGTFGTLLLTLLGIGLLGYAALRLWQGLGNPEGHGNDAKGIGIRVGRVATGLTQAALAFYALSLAYGWFSGGGGEGGAADLTARAMAWPAGRWIVGAVGVAICVAAFAQLAGAVKASFLRELAISGDKDRWVKPLGRAAYAARFVVFLIVGGFVIAAAYQAEPGQARGLGGALQTLQQQPYGPWLLGLTGAGLIAFAALRAVFARYAILPSRR